MRRYLLFLIILGSLAHDGAAAEVHYRGIVRRMPNGQPVAGVPVSACVDLAPDPRYPKFSRVDETAKTRTAQDGTSSFTIPLRAGLYFTAWGEITATVKSPTVTQIHDLSRTLRRPRTDRLNVIEVPRRFKPETTGWAP